MTVAGTAGTNQSSSIGPGVAEIASSAALVCAITANTAHTIILPTGPWGATLDPTLPITACFPSTNLIQGQTNNNLPTNLGVMSVVQAAGSPTTVTITIANSGAAATITAGTRILLMQNQGV